MKLIDLNPRWLEDCGYKGLSFDCPHCKEQRLAVLFKWTLSFPEQHVIAFHGGDNNRHIWELLGNEDFNTLTLTPSIDASASGHWHGFITNGYIV